MAWRELHRTGPPQGLSRDLLIRALAHRLQEKTHGGTSQAQRRRLQTLAREFEKGSASFDPGIMLKTGTTLVRQWRGHTHTVLEREDGFEYEGRHYRSLTVIAERITGAHWSGPALLRPNQASGRFAPRRGQPMTRSASSGTRRNATVRCAIYARKSSEEGLDQEFNSLQAQREALRGPSSTANGTKAGCACPNVYDDGGFSGATIGRRCNGCSPTSRRGGNRPLDLPPLCRARLGPVIEGGARSTRDQKQVLDERFGSAARRQAILARCAPPDIAEPHLSRRGRSQGANPSRRTHADHRSAAVGRGSGAARATPLSGAPATAPAGRACSPACCSTPTATR